MRSIFGVFGVASLLLEKTITRMLEELETSIQDEIEIRRVFEEKIFKLGREARARPR